MRVTLCVAAVTLLAGCGGNFASDDPNGFAACQALVRVRQTSTTDYGPRLDALNAVIRYSAAAASKDVTGAQHDSDQLAKVCDGHGVTVPSQV